jgi:hypothetical protein
VASAVAICSQVRALKRALATSSTFVAATQSSLMRGGRSRKVRGLSLIAARPAPRDIGHPERVDIRTGLPGFVTHYYLPGRRPFLSLSELGALAKAVGGFGVASKWFYEAYSSNASTPGFAELQAEYKKVYKSGSPNPGNRINYDGTILLALAMTAARSTSPDVYMKYVKQVSGQAGTMVTSYAQGVAALKAGKKIYYDGAEGVYNFNQYLWPSEPFVLWGLTAQGNVTPVLTLSASQVSSSY